MKNLTDKQKAVLIILFIILFCVGFLLGIACGLNIVNKRDNDKKQNIVNEQEEKIYSKSSSVLIGSTNNEEDTSIESSDLNINDTLLNTYNFVLEKVKNSPKSKYPNSYYEVNLEKVKDTEILKIVVSSKNSDNLADICNEITKEFVNTIEQAYNVKCSIIDVAE